MAQEWLNAVLTVEWLLGASMALAGKKLLSWAEATVATFRQTREEVQKSDGDSDTVEIERGSGS